MIPQAYFAGEDVRLNEISFLFFFPLSFFYLYFFGLDWDRVDTIY